MKILVACEESQKVCKAFRARGHEAYSCDILKCSGGHPEWHILHDVSEILNGSVEFETMDGHKHCIDGAWDMVIAFPPCTHLAVSGAQWFKLKRESGLQEEAIRFFCMFLECNAKKLVIENPVGIISGHYVWQYYPFLAGKYNLPCKPTQVIEPWMFGDPYPKKTCLWIKGVKPLVPEITEKPEMEYVQIITPGRKPVRLPKWYSDCFRLPPDERARKRSTTFDGIARAMAEQWG